MPYLVSSPCPPSPCPLAPALLLHLATASMTGPQFIDRDGHLHHHRTVGRKVQFSHETCWTFHPGALTKVHGGLAEPSSAHCTPFHAARLALGVLPLALKDAGSGPGGSEGIQSQGEGLQM